MLVYSYTNTKDWCTVIQKRYHRITEWWGLEGTSGDHLDQPPCLSRHTQSRGHRTASRQVLNVSREGDSTASLGSLCHCSGTLTGKEFFSILGGTSCVPACAHCPLSCHWAPLKRVWSHSLGIHPSHIYKYW